MQAPGGFLDNIIQPLYDTVLLPAAGAQVLLFFQVPRGAGLSSFQGVGGIQPKTYADTNMEVAGMLPAGLNFSVHGFRLAFPWNITDNDMNVAINGAVFTFEVTSKPYLRVPARCIPGGNGPSGSGASLNNNGWPVLTNGYAISNAGLLDLAQTQGFNVTLAWPGGVQAVTTNFAGFVAPGLPITIYLDGLQKRITQ